MPHLRLSFDLRRPEFVTATAAELAAAMLEICEWADGLGFDLMPSPLIASAAVASRTSRMRFATNRARSAIRPTPAR